MARLLVHARAGLEMTTSPGVCLDVATRRDATVLANLRRFAFLIRCGNALAGCALVTRGSSASDDPDAFDVAEFFVVRRHRRSGVGRTAALLLWNRFGGNWTVPGSEGNLRGCECRASVVSDYAGGAAIVTTRPGSPHPWLVFSFDRRNVSANT